MRKIVSFIMTRRLILSPGPLELFAPLYCGRRGIGKPKALSGSGGVFDFFQVFGEEQGDFLEFGDVGGVDLHQDPVGFKAIADDFLAGGSGLGDGCALGRGTVGQGGIGTGDEVEEMDDAEVFEEFSDAGIGIEQFDGAAVVFGVFAGADHQAEAGKDTEKGAVHESAFGKVQDDADKILFNEFVQEGFEVNAGRKVCPA